MKTEIILTLILFLSLFIGCSITSDKIPQSIIEEVEQLSLTPDSLLSPSQLSKKEDIYEIIKTYTKVEGNKLVTKATPKDFKRKGLSIYYYNYYLKNIQEINATLELNPLNMQEIYDQMLNNYNPNQ